jgi:hypothetical protein
MHHAAWKNLADSPNVREDFPHAASWAKAEMSQPKGSDSTTIHTRLEIVC